MTEETWLAILLAVVIVLAIRASWRLRQRYVSATNGDGSLSPDERLMLGIVVALAWFVTGVNVYLGILSIRQMLGFPPLEWAPVVSTGLLLLLLLIPTVLDVVIGRIAQGRWRP